MIEQFWILIVPTNIKVSFFILGPKEWINFNLNVNQYWAWRNKEYYDDNYNKPPSLDMHIHSRMNDYVKAMKNNKIIVGRNKTLSRIGWKSPETQIG